MAIAGIAVAALMTLHGAPRAQGSSAPAAQRALRAAERAASAWIAQQVDPATVIACDAQMCATLRAQGLASGQLRVLGPASSYPTTSALVVDTATVRRLFGSSLGAQVAPETLSSFGTGPALVSVRAVAPKGATAYEHALSADRGVRQQTGAALVASGRQIRAQATAREQLSAGMVDTRLLFLMAALAGVQPIDIVDFGNIGSGGSPDLPLRYADVAENDSAAHLGRPAYLSALLKALHSVPPLYRPIRAVTVELAPGVTVLRIEVGAPSPLGLFGS